MTELTLALAREMLTEAGVTGVDPADRLADGSAMDTWRRMIRAQGGDPEGACPPRRRPTWSPPRHGTLVRLDAMAVGLAAWRTGAGQAHKEDPVRAGAGVEMHAKPGDTVTEGQPLLTLHATSRSGSSGRSTAWTAATTSATVRRTPRPRWCWTGSPPADLPGEGRRARRPAAGGGAQPSQPPRETRPGTSSARSSTSAADTALREHHVEGALLAGQGSTRCRRRRRWW